MQEELRAALDGVDKLALTLFTLDPATREVGVGLSEGRPAFFTTRNIAAEIPKGARIRPLESFHGFPVLYDECEEDPRPLQAMPEQLHHRPLVCGLEVQNLDQDFRDGFGETGVPNVGTLGCFVRLGDGTEALLSNNHIIAGENAGLRGRDRIVQPSFRPHGGTPAATLNAFVQLIPSTPLTAFAHNGRAPNIVDAAVAAVDVGWRQSYLPGRLTLPATSVAGALPADPVSKVGRTTGETTGVATLIGVTLGPIRYKIGPCWFRRSIVIESDDARPFASGGDSGAVIIRGSGEAVGLLYGGLPGVPGKRKHRTYACPMGEVLRLLGCTLA